MKLFIDLFCGSASFKAPAVAAGFDYIGVDWHPYEHADLVIDIEHIDLMDFPVMAKYAHIHIHMSPDCRTYSIAQFGKHRDLTRPKSEYAAKCDAVNIKALEFLAHVQSLYSRVTYDIENPRGLFISVPSAIPALLLSCAVVMALYSARSSFRGLFMWF